MNGARKITPVSVTGLTGVTIMAIAAGDWHSLALDSDGNLWAWGRNENGQLGDGTFAGHQSPVAVSMPEGITFTAIAAGRSFSMALDNNGNVWAWGYSMAVLCRSSIDDLNRLLPTIHGCNAAGREYTPCA